jgi:hypothetical protein
MQQHYERYMRTLESGCDPTLVLRSRLGRCVEHQSAGSQLAPGFSALRLEFESLTIADHLRRDVPADGSAWGAGFRSGLRHAGADGNDRAGYHSGVAAASLLGLIQEAVGLEVRSFRGPALCIGSIIQLPPCTACLALFCRAYHMVGCSSAVRPGLICNLEVLLCRH